MPMRYEMCIRDRAYKEANEKMQKQYGQAELKAAFAYKQAQAAAQKEERDALLWEKAKRCLLYTSIENPWKHQNNQQFLKLYRPREH